MTAAEIFLGLGLFLLLLGMHPFVFYPVSLLFARKLPPLQAGVANAASRPSVAICMAAYNEEKVIVRKIETLLAMAARYGPATVHVYVDCPADATARLLQPYADRIDLVIGETRQGKTYGMNVLVKRSTSDLLLFTDANVSHEINALELLAQPFADPQVGMTTARLNYVNHAESATSAMGAFYWSVEESIKKIESETVGIIGVDGAMFMVRRDLYRPAPPHLIDDFYVSLSVLIAGARVISVDDVWVSERSATNAFEEFKRKTRIACQSLNVHRALWRGLRRMPPLFVYAYISHRVLKWFLPFTLLFSGLSLFVSIGLAFGWKTAALVLLAAVAPLVVGAMLRIKPAPHAMTALLSIAGVGNGVLQSLFLSRTYTVWQLADSVREES